LWRRNPTFFLQPLPARRLTISSSEMRTRLSLPSFMRLTLVPPFLKCSVPMVAHTRPGFFSLPAGAGLFFHDSRRTLRLSSSLLRNPTPCRPELSEAARGRRFPPFSFPPPTLLFFFSIFLFFPPRLCVLANAAVPFPLSFATANTQPFLVFRWPDVRTLYRPLFFFLGVLSVTVYNYLPFFFRGKIMTDFFFLPAAGVLSFFLSTSLIRGGMEPFFYVSSNATLFFPQPSRRSPPPTFGLRYRFRDPAAGSRFAPLIIFARALLPITFGRQNKKYLGFFGWCWELLGFFFVLCFFFLATVFEGPFFWGAGACVFSFHTATRTAAFPSFPP